jgi:hypothetical protein
MIFLTRRSGCPVLIDGGAAPIDMKRGILDSTIPHRGDAAHHDHGGSL